jgi:hypothetical protein
MLTVRGGQPLHARRGKKMHPVFWLQAQLLDGRADCKSHLLELDEALVSVRAKLKVVPVLIDLLLLAVDHLLDLLRLGDLVDDAARADGLCVAKLCRGVAHDLVHGGDIGRWRGLEAVFGGQVAARYRLALDLLCACCLCRVGTSPGGLGLGRPLLEVLSHGTGWDIKCVVVCGCVQIQRKGDR